MSKHLFKYRLFSAVMNFIMMIFVSSFPNNLEGAEISRRDVGDPNCSIKPCSSWVKNIPIKYPDDSEFFKNFPDSYLLIDHQIEADQKEVFYHVIRHLSSPGGVQENSTINLGFDPLYESIVFHNLVVVRNNTYIDKVDTARMEVIHQEKNISDSIYDGTKSWIFFLEDVQPGDIIEYSYSRIGRLPVLEKYLTTMLSLQRETHIFQGFFRLVGCDASRFNFHRHLTATMPKQQDLGGGKKEWIWEVSDTPAYEGISSLPIWYIAMPYIQISSFKDWAEVANWGTNLFQLPENYSEELTQLANVLKSKSPLLEEQILHAIRFVQDEIRYLGYELGDNAYKPYDPHIVLKRRSGDCKDKVMFLMSLLDLMGVRSCPVLVNTSLQEHISDWLPTPTILNHAILQIQIENNRFWVDPTKTYSGGSLRNMVCGPFGNGLLLSKETINLTEIPFDAKGSLRKATTTVDLSQTDAYKVISETLYTGFWADTFRSRYYSGNGLKVIEKRFKDFFSKLYGALTTSTPFDIKDDLEKNEIIIRVAYNVKDPWKVDDVSKTLAVDYYASEIGDLLSLSVDSMRKAPCELPCPGYAIDEFFMIFPKTKSLWDFTPYRFELDNDELRFLTEWKQKDSHCLHCYYELMAKKDHVPSEKIEEWYRDSQQISSLISRTLFHPDEKGNMALSIDSSTPMFVSRLIYVILCIFSLLIWIYYMRK
ncbi:MAG: DUF3857 domain-containing protein [Parachlamydiaceae bacterium]|nr:DUF3857 domain-containing protein [Parachlamydiaceae bacterium]